MSSGSKIEQLSQESSMYCPPIGNEKIDETADDKSDVKCRDNFSLGGGSGLWVEAGIVGRVVDSAGFALGHSGTMRILVCSTGKQLVSYESQRLRICGLSPFLPGPIKHMCSAIDGKRIFASVGARRLLIWGRHSKLSSFLIRLRRPAYFKGLVPLENGLLSYGRHSIYWWSCDDKEILMRSNIEDLFENEDELLEEVDGVLLHHRMTEKAFPIEVTEKAKQINQNCDGPDILMDYRKENRNVEEVVTPRVSALREYSPIFSSEADESTSISTFDSERCSEGQLGRSVWQAEEVFRSELDFEISCVKHPIGFNNKVVICGCNGEVLIQNIRTRRLVYRLQCVRRPSNNAYIICAGSSSCSNDILAFGTLDGLAMIANLRHDRLLMSFSHNPSQGSVHSLAFYDGSIAVTTCFLICGLNNGDITLWNLNNQALHCIFTKAHSSRVTTIHCFPDQPLMFTAGADNCIIMWIFDMPNGSPRVLKKRSGLPSQITHLRFYDEENMDLIGCSEFKGKCFIGKISAIQQQRNSIFSQKQLSKIFKHKHVTNLPRIVDVSINRNRHYDWDNIVTIHHTLSVAFLWNFHNNCLSRKILRIENSMRKPRATSCTISLCGHFVIVGYVDGQIHRYNLQSALHKGDYQKKSLGKAHSGSICSLHPLDQNIFLSASSDCKDRTLVTWNMSKHQLEKVLDLDNKDNLMAKHDCISAVEISPSSVICAVVLSRRRVLLCDLLALVVVHEVHSLRCGFVTIIHFSPDGRRLIVCTHDGSLLIYDLLSRVLIDWIMFKSPVTAIAYHPSGHFLYTAHQNSIGEIRVWADRYVFDDSSCASILQRIPTVPYKVDENSNKNICNNNLLQKKRKACKVGIFNETSESNRDNGNQRVEISQDLRSFATGPLSPFALTLSGLHPNRLFSILHWNRIRQKSKSLDETENSEEVPFFLPSILDGNKGMAMNLDINKFEHYIDTLSKDKFIDEKKDDTLKNKHISMKSTLQCLLFVAKNEDNQKLKYAKYADILKYFLSLSPPAINLALSELGELACGNEDEIYEMLCFFEYYVDQRDFVDFIQCLLLLFLRIHGEYLSSSSLMKETVEKLEFLKNKIYEDAKLLDNLSQKIICLLKVYTQLQI